MCFAQGARLASIPTASQMSFIYNNAPSHSTIWVGINNVDGTWMDVRGNTRGPQGEIPYTNWDTGEPNNAFGACAIITPVTGKWAVHACTGNQLYVCAKG